MRFDSSAGNKLRMTLLGAILGGFFFVVYTAYGRYQYLESSVLDYVILIALAAITGFLAFLHLARGHSDWVSVIKRGSTYRVLLLATAFTLFVGGALVKVCNGAFDTHPATNYTTRVLEARCGKYSVLLVKGAPFLPTHGEVVTISTHLFDGLDLCNLHPGERLLVSVGPGFLGRAWITQYRLP